MPRFFFQNPRISLRINEVREPLFSTKRGEKLQTGNFRFCWISTKYGKDVRRGNYCKCSLSSYNIKINVNFCFSFIKIWSFMDSNNTWIHDWTVNRIWKNSFTRYGNQTLKLINISYMLYYILALILFMLSMIFFIKSINARILKKPLSIKNIYTGYL